jgi:ComF family protein
VTTAATEWLDRPRNWLDGAISVLMPRRCPICGTTLPDRQRAWCERCESGMKVYDRPICPECRRFLNPGGSACQLGHDMSESSIVHALGAFDGAFGVMVHALKYDGFRDLAKPLGTLLAGTLHDGQIDVIVAVPTSARKKRKRGFGHAEEIASACGQETRVRSIPDALRFTRAVADQTKLNAAKRKANLRGAFAVRDGISLDGSRVLIVDDVLTTGATMCEAARAIKAAGAATVSGGIVALNLSMQNRGA